MLNKFDGTTFNQSRDAARLGEQMSKVFKLMSDGLWRTLSDIAELTESPESSVSARLRDLRKERHGKHTVERQYVKNGLHQYRLTLNSGES